MQPAPLPANEAARLAELHALKLLDTLPEERFDSVVRLTQQLFQTPIVYIALIDSDRQWFKAKCGLTVDETGREVSFCGHAILQKTALVVPDARLDARFVDNPLVIGQPYVRFYAGHPLAGPTGMNVGTLCVVDTQPREFSDRDIGTLQRLAEVVEQQLRFHDVIATQQRLIETQQALVETQRRLEHELHEAATYVQSQLPERLSSGPIRADWEFVESSHLAGDGFGYHAIGPNKFALYLLDVCGHGVGAALLAITVQNALRRQALAECDFSDPGQVLAALDRAFPMAAQQDKFFTIWYGVYDQETRELRYATAGHHAALLFEPGSREPTALGAPSLMIGLVDDRVPTFNVRTIAPASRLLIFSDGVFEIRRPDGQMLGLAGATQVFQASAEIPANRTRWIRERLQEWQQQESFPDDFSLLEFLFP